jgi:uncharacterized protein (TIGR00162 family)
VVRDIQFKDITVVYEGDEPHLDAPIMIEGLPGVGNVGKLAAEHLIEEIKAKKFATIYSKYFPPQVLVEEDGVARLVCNELFYHKKVGEEKHDVIVLVGDYQGLTPEGQFMLSAAMIEIAKKFKVHEIYTLGGFGVGHMVEEPRVLGAASDKALIERLKGMGITFSRGEPGSGIVGASGLLLAFGQLSHIPSACLMGETSGYFVDPASARALLTRIQTILGVKLDLAKLDEKASQIDKITSKLKELEQVEQRTASDDLRYIG